MQFGIRDLLIAQAICAACCGLFVMVGIFALMAIFVATLILCACRVPPERARLKRFVVDLLGGVMLPVLCIAYDPMVFRNSGDLRVIGYLTIATQILALVTWMTIGWWLGRGSAVFSGFLFVGAVVSGIIGVLLAFFSTIGLLFYGIGMLGFTPFLTCVVFSRNARQARRQAAAAADKRTSVPLFLLGALLAVAIPVLICWAAGPWLEHWIKLMPRPRDFSDGLLKGFG